MPDTNAMARRTRQRWPARNMDEMVRHVSRQYPEVDRRQVRAILQTFLVSVRESCLDQWVAGESRPGVSFRSFGRFELAFRKARPNQFGGRLVPAKWTMVLRPKGTLMRRIKEITSKTVAEPPIETNGDALRGTTGGVGVNGATEEVPRMRSGTTEGSGS